MHFKTIPPLPMTSSSLSRAFSGSGSARKPKNDTETNEIWKPETLIGQCEMSVDAVTSFIQHNCVEFFSEIGDLAVGLRTLSDADLFIGRIFSTSHVRKAKTLIYNIELIFYPFLILVCDPSLFLLVSRPRGCNFPDSLC